MRHRQYQCYFNIHFWIVSVAQMVASMSGSVRRSCSGPMSNLARDEKMTASVASVDSLYPSVFIYCVNLHLVGQICEKIVHFMIKA